MEILKPSFPISVPPEFYKKISTLLEAFRIVGESGASSADVNAIFEALPEDLQQAPVYFCEATKVWRYEYGLPYDRLYSEAVVFGTNQWPPVERLFQGLKAAKTLLGREVFVKIAKSLGQKNKHKDYLVELAPLARVGKDIEAHYEVMEGGQDNRTVDWLFRQSAKTPILVEVKHRVLSLLELIGQVAEDKPESGHSLEMASDYDRLFLDVLKKFKVNSPDDFLQGAWIEKYIKLNREAFRTYFKNLDSQKLHFVVFNDGGA